MDDQIVPSSAVNSTGLALRKTLDIICGKWRLYIIFQLGTETRRYGELRRMIPEVSEKVLIQELKALVSLGMLEKKSFSEIPPRVEYGLTGKGLRVLPTLLNLITVGETFLDTKPADGYIVDGLPLDGQLKKSNDRADGIR